MRIEEGKFYRTRDGRKVGPAKLRSAEFGFWDLGENFDVCHGVDGTYVPGREMPDDLVAEWTEGPVRTVTRQEIIPGTYDGVWVTNVKGGKVSVKLVGLGDWADMDADALTRAAAVLTALAGALRDGS